MSLNRYEQAVFDYLQSHPEELRHWENKVSTRAMRGELPPHQLVEELSDYIRERGTHTRPFSEWMEVGGVPRSSLRNLADYLLRIWGPVVAKKKPAMERP